MYSKCTDCRIKYNTKYIGMVTLMIDSHSVLILYYVITFVSDLRQVGVFLRVLRFPSPIKLTATISMNYILQV